MFRALPCPSSGAYNCISSLWFYLWSVVGRGLAGYNHEQQLCYRHVPTVKPEAVKRPKPTEPHINVK